MIRVPLCAAAPTKPFKESKSYDDGDLIPRRSAEAVRSIKRIPRFGAPNVRGNGKSKRHYRWHIVDAQVPEVQRLAVAVDDQLRVRARGNAPGGATPHPGGSGCGTGRPKHPSAVPPSPQRHAALLLGKQL